MSLIIIKLPLHYISYTQVELFNHITILLLNVHPTNGCHKNILVYKDFKHNVIYFFNFKCMKCSH